MAARSALRRLARAVVARRGPGVRLSSTGARNEPLSAELEAKAKDRFDELAESHRAIPVDQEIRRKRLIYRSKQRGWLEVDLLLGTFATEHVASFTTREMDEYEAILNCETIDIFNFVTAKDPVPPSLDTPMMARLQQFSRESPLGVGLRAYADAKTKSNLT